MAKSKSGSLFVWIAVGILTFGMVGFGATGLTGRIKSIGTVGDVPIPVTTYANALQAEIAARSAQFGTRLSFAQAQELGLTQRVQASVVSDHVLDNEMLQLGISAGDDEVRKAVLANPAFRGADGTFDRDRYREVLSANRVTEGDYEASIRSEAVRAMMQGAVLSGLSEPRTYADTLATYIGEHRDFTWAQISELDAQLPEPSDEDLRSHYEANPDDFTTPETKALTYVWLTPDMIQDDVTVDEAELRADYEARIDDFVQPERRLVERLAFSSHEAAQEALDAIASGDTDFDALVTERGLDLADVDLGDMSEAQLRDAGADVFAASPGDVVGPHDSPVGPALFRMNAILAGRETPFEDAVPELREDRAAARARRVIQEQVDPITDLLAGGARMEDLAERTPMQLDTFDWTSQSEDGIAAYAAFRDAVSELEPGAFPELLELEDGGVFAVRVDEVKAPALRPFADARDDIVAGWQATETQRRLRAQAEALQEQVAAGADFPELEIDATTERDLTRRDFLNGTPPQFMDTVFAMMPGDVEIVEGPGAMLLVRLDDVSPPPADDPAVEAEASAIAANASEAIARDLYTYFTRSLQMQTDIQIDPQAVNAVHANFQ